jgi:hypothetical protein
MKKGFREKEALRRMKLQGREAIKHFEKNVSNLRENEMLSPLWFHFKFPTHLCTSEGSSHMKGIHQHSLSLLRNVTQDSPWLSPLQAPFQALEFFS